MSASSACDVLEAILVSDVRYGYRLHHPRTMESLRADCARTPELDTRADAARRRMLEGLTQSC